MKNLKSFILLVLEAIKELFSTDMDVPSKEAQKLMSNKNDREKYFRAIQELREKEKNGQKPEVTFTTENKKIITICRR